MAAEIKAGEFKAKCLKLMDQVAESGEELTITKHGKPVAKLVPIQKKPATLFGAMADQIETTGDIMSPIDAGWEVLDADEAEMPHQKRKA